MDMPLSERRQIENEMIFRRGNEELLDQLKVLDEHHIEDGNPELVNDESILLHFKCECSDENCEDRIPIRMSDYRGIHDDRDAFIVKKDHQVNAIETVIYSEPTYSIVQKNNTIAEPNNGLNVTTIDNSL